MNGVSWQILREISAGDVWAAIAEHPPVDCVDRTHYADHTSLGLWLSPSPNRSRGRFLMEGFAGNEAPLGSIVAIPAGLAFNVRSEATPARMMLHCRLPQRASFSMSDAALDACVDLRSGAVQASLSRLAREVREPGFGSSAIVEGLGLLVAGELARSLAGGVSTERKGGLAPWQLRRIDDYIHAGHWDCSISDLARLCGISPGHAMRAFRQSTGRSIASHVAILRIDRARRLLAANDLSIGAIASELRFSRASSFNVAFRRISGITPREFRQRRRGGSE